MNAPIPHWPGELRPAGGQRLFVRSAPGEGEPAVFVHGLAGSATNWTDLMSELSDRLAGDAVDLPGFGHSPPPAKSDYSISAHARAVAGFIAARGRGPVHLFGNSLGGAVATRLAARRPDLVKTLTLVSPALPDLRPRYGPTRIAAAAIPGFGAYGMRKLSALPAEHRVQGSMEMCYADPSLMHPERLMALVEEIRRRDDQDHTIPAIIGSARGAVVEYLRLGPRSLWRDAATIGIPTLVLYGQDDRIVDARKATRANRAFRGARVVVLPRVGHVGQMERPDLVAAEFRTLHDHAMAQWAIA
jgi:pimeloyl-ACP methyl ester carboxylesterase